MRKQYHFRNSDQGLLAWDIDNLIRLTKNLEAIEQPLNDIRELDKPYWYDLERAIDQPANPLRITFTQFKPLTLPIQ